MKMLATIKNWDREPGLSVARSVAHRKVEGAAADRPSRACVRVRACPATRYLNLTREATCMQHAMQPNEGTNERTGGAEMPIGDYIDETPFLPHFPFRSSIRKAAKLRHETKEFVF